MICLQGLARLCPGTLFICRDERRIYKYHTHLYLTPEVIITSCCEVVLCCSYHDIRQHARIIVNPATRAGYIPPSANIMGFTSAAGEETVE